MREEDKDIIQQTALIRRENIANTLKTNRKKNQYSKEYVMDYLKRNHIQDISTSTLYSWENANSSPSINVFLELCKLYHISEILYAFGYDNMPTEQQLLRSLSCIEQRLIVSYRSTTSVEQDVVNKILKL